MKDSTVQQIIDEFSLFDEWEDKYAYVIDLGKKLPSLLPADRIEANKVQGCTSTVWLVSVPINTAPVRYQFYADSDAHIVKGLVAILLRVYSNKTAEEIKALDIQYLFQALGFNQFLSPSRSNGFFAMVKRIYTLIEGE